MGSVSADKAWDFIIRPWWAKVLAAVVLILIGFSVFKDYSNLESGEKKSFFTDHGTRTLYSIGGKWLAAGVPVTAGLGMAAWAIAQLVAGMKTAPASIQSFPQAQSQRQSQTAYNKAAAAPPIGPAASDEPEPSAAQALFVTFYKPIGILGVILHFGIAIVLGRYLFPDLNGAWYGVIALLAAALVFFELEIFSRSMGWDEGPIVDWNLRASWLIALGMLAALGLATFLAFNASAGDESERLHEQQAAQERADRARVLNSPEVKAAQEALRRRQEQPRKP